MMMTADDGTEMSADGGIIHSQLKVGAKMKMLQVADAFVYFLWVSITIKARDRGTHAYAGPIRGAPPN